MPNVDDATVQAMAQRLRRDSLVSTAEAGSGHPTTCMSAAEIVSTLFFREMAYDPRDPWRPGTDHFVLSKGHAAPILWGALTARSRGTRSRRACPAGGAWPRAPGARGWRRRSAWRSAAGSPGTPAV